MREFVPQRPWDVKHCVGGGLWTGLVKSRIANAIFRAQGEFVLIDVVALFMTPDEINGIVIQAWNAVELPRGFPTGLAHEAPDAETEIESMNYLEFSRIIIKYEHYSLFCFFTPEYACYYCGGFLIYGLSEWFGKALEENYYDGLADNLYYFLCGQRWPVKQIAKYLTPLQIKAVAAFMGLSESIIGGLAVPDKTKLLFPKASTDWEFIDMGIEPD